MPKERLSTETNEQRKGPPEVYVTLRDLIAIQFEARGFSFLPKHAVQSLLSGRHRSKLRGRGLDFDEVRQYVAGDDIRNIDWKVTARVGVTHTKVYTEEKERPVFLIVDQSSSMFFGSKVYLKSVIAAHLAALTCWRVIDVGDRIGGIVFNDKRVDYVSPKRDRRSVQRFLSFITDQNQELGPKKAENTISFPLNEALKQANEVVTHDYLVVIISDLYQGDMSTLRQMIRLRRNNDVIVGHIADPAERELSSGKITLSDGLYQTRLEKDRKVREEFAREKEANFQRIQSDLKKYGIPFLTFNTEEEASLQLRSMMGARTGPKR